MESLKIETQIEVYRDTSELPKLDRELVLAAKEATYTSYAPYSNFFVGAALRMGNGEIVLGSNQENAAYPVCQCAERTALHASSALYPGIPVIQIAVIARVGEGFLEQPVTPCGACRQVLSEYEQRAKGNLEVFLVGGENLIYKIKSAKDLLPLSFDSSFLKVP